MTEKTVLIIEDEEDAAELFAEMMRVSGYRVLKTSKSTPAISMMTTEKPDIVLLDIMMPKLTGLDVLKQLRALPAPAKDTPVFIITNLGQQNMIEAGFKMGMDGYIIKSQVTPQQIVSEINTFFDNKEAAPIG